MQPAPPPTPPTPPAPPTPAGLPDQSDPPVTASDAAAALAAVRPAPRTREDIAGLRQQRSALSDQLISAQRRRADVARSLERAENPASRSGLEQRLGVLDRRILQIEEDIAETGRLITTASPALLVSAPGPISFPQADRGPPETVVAIVFILFGVFPLVLALSRRLFRGRPVARPDALALQTAERLGRMEQAVEAIAIEVERVSEGQRFVTRLLAESRQPLLVQADADATVDAVPRGRPNG
jgi:hypothetical protein